MKPHRMVMKLQFLDKLVLLNFHISVVIKILCKDVGKISNYSELCRADVDGSASTGRADT